MLKNPKSASFLNFAQNHEIWSHCEEIEDQCNQIFRPQKAPFFGKNY